MSVTTAELSIHKTPDGELLVGNKENPDLADWFKTEFEDRIANLSVAFVAVDSVTHTIHGVMGVENETADKPTDRVGLTVDALDPRYTQLLLRQAHLYGLEERPKSSTLFFQTVTDQSTREALLANNFAQAEDGSLSKHF